MEKFKNTDIESVECFLMENYSHDYSVFKFSPYFRIPFYYLIYICIYIYIYNDNK